VAKISNTPTSKAVIVSFALSKTQNHVMEEERILAEG
jgi:hypothetical protein